MNSPIALVVLSLLAVMPRASEAQALPGPLLEAQAIARMQQTPLSQLDPALPNRPFGKWFGQVVGDDAGVSWQLTDCGEQSVEEADRERELPACAEVTAILASGRMVAVAAQVGTFKQGLTGAPQLRFIVVEDYGRLRKVERLSDLQAVLRQPPARPSRMARSGPLLPTTRAARPPLVLHKTPPPLDDGLIGPIRMTAGADAPPPPLPVNARPANLRVSEGVLLANATTKVIPIYPSVARQINASGEVKVQVTIGEDGKVVEAVATSGHPLLRNAAEDAAWKWVFKPAIFNGRPIQSQGTLTFLFERPQ
ncbi:MAG: TonB family protein [Blastocatellia bacterium]